MKIRIYVEGGGDARTLKTACRRGFSKFFSKAGLERRMPKVIPCGGRGNAYDDFCIAMKDAAPDELPMLLVDSEAPVARALASDEAEAAQQRWQHLANRVGDGWSKPAGTTDDQTHLMVQCMEAWFLADRVALIAYFGRDFKENKLPRNTNVEQIAKQTVFDGLKAATRGVKPKGSYDKGRHSFEILARLDPGKVAEASPHAERLIVTLRRLCGT